MNGLYLCGAGIHPGGSVIGINGRNAAMTVLADLASQKQAGVSRSPAHRAAP
jgi:phytoene dehydrogenase-like protein